MINVGAWATLPPRLRGFYLANALSQTLCVIGLSIGEVFGGSRNLALSLMAVGIAWLVTLAAVPLIRRFGVTMAVASLTVSASAFAVSGVYINPFLSPMAVLALLVPLLLAYPYLPPRVVAWGVAYAIVSTAAIAAFAEYRRDHTGEPTTFTEVIALLVFTPSIVAVLAYEVGSLYREMTHQADELRRSRNQIGEVAIAARKSLERDLHDGAQQRLIGLTVQSRLARNALAAGDLRAADEFLASLDAESQAAVQDLRDLAQGIYPPLLAERGLGPALKAVALRSPVPCVLFVERLHRYDPSLEAGIYFCIHEALQNAVKHADASEITMQIRGEPELEFAVIDNGRGFDPSRLRPTSGLLGLQVRVEAMGGQFTVRSRPGAGTIIRAVIPDIPRVSDR